MEKKMHEEYPVQIMIRYEEKDGRWTNAVRYDPIYNSKAGQRYVKTEAEAKAVLDRAYQMRNGKKFYNENGERITTQSAGMIGVSMVHTKESDKAHEIVKHRIRKRLVTDWEIVEEG